MVAIGQQARAAAIPVSVDGHDVGRYTREVEAAVYFSVLEALQNTTKYADAASVAITLARRLLAAGADKILKRILTKRPGQW